MRSRLFFASCLSLSICGALFAIRSAAADELGAEFATDKAVIGGILAMGFYGMGWVIAVASPLCDFVGMRTLVLLAAGALDGLAEQRGAERLAGADRALGMQGQVDPRRGRGLLGVRRRQAGGRGRRQL